MRTSVQNFIYSFPQFVIDESESTMSTRFFVHHQSRVRDRSERPPVLSERFCGTRSWECSDEEFVGFGRIGSWDRSFGINLISIVIDGFESALQFEVGNEGENRD